MAASSSASSKVSLKLLIDTNAKKVLFAEANKEFVDFLFYILSLPVGTVIKLLSKNSMVGSLGKLYGSIESLCDTYMQPNQTKDSVLNPKTNNYVANVPFLLTNDDVPKDRRIYYHRCSYDNNAMYVSEDPNVQCSQCSVKLTYVATYVRGTSAAKEMGEGGGGFVKGVVTYMVMDDLEVKPMSTISSITMLNKFNVKEVCGLREKVVSLEMNEGLMLLKASLQCNNVLTRVFLS